MNLRLWALAATAAAGMGRGMARIKYSCFSFLSVWFPDVASHWGDLNLKQRAREPVNVVHRDQHLRSQNKAEKLKVNVEGQMKVSSIGDV